MTLALAGDTMLGRKVADAAVRVSPRALFAGELVALARQADLLVVNLECCVSTRGEPVDVPGKPFFFRAPPVSLEALRLLGVSCVTLANNHALDFGPTALLDTLGHLEAAGIRAVGAGPRPAQARAPAVLAVGGFRLGVVAVTDHPAEYAAGPGRPGVAYADLRHGVPDWLLAEIQELRGRVDAVLITPHWGPNMTPAPVPHVRAAARAFVQAGATLVAGHSAHVFHGVDGPVLYDLGGFVDDYAVHPVLRNDLGLLFLVTLDAAGPVRLEAVPLALGYCHTRLAGGADADWVRERFTTACEDFGTPVSERDGRLVVDYRA
ncbi:MAG TPA: CapA family protein, partial [Frankiaceae bacterium]|nr:CapA family protein [Frankiaceae bacterium]